MKKSKFSLILSLLLVLSLFLAACSGKDDEANTNANEKPGKDNEKKEELADNQEVRILESTEIPGMDSAKVSDTISFTMINATQEGLYRQNQDNKFEPGVADGEPEMGSDGKEFTIKLKNDVKWSNGDPVTAHDFVYGWQRAIDPKTKSDYGSYMMDHKILGAAEITQAGADNKKYDLNSLGIKAVDDYTVKVQTEKPMTVEFFKGLMAFGTYMPQNQKFVEAQSGKYAATAANLLSNGPFKMTKWDGPTASEWVLEKNEGYRDADNVTLNKLTFNVQKDSQAAVNALEAGEVDVTIKLSSDVVPQYADDPRMLRWLEPTVFWLKMNQKDNKALQNVNIRKALAQSFNKEDLAAAVLNNGSKPANFAVPADFVKDEKGEDFRKGNGDMLTYDPKEAKKNWEAGLKEIGKKDLTIRYLGGDTETSKKTDQYMKDQMEKTLPGLTIKLESVPFKIRLDRDTKQDYDLQAAGWGPDYLDPISFSDLWVTDGGNNKMSYSNPEYDKLIQDAQNSSDFAQRWEDMQKAEKIVMDDAAIAPMYQRASNLLIVDKVKGFKYHLVGPEYSYQYMKVLK
ncbi:peptide ABC transporter substrate-binding protein [Bacillus sp. 1P06AnD]|uniref:peptide ABC transporter substrate-binding protein n=1 Tax=Bacillus sp. 1P06AnD TaxID=3132208 RepID=UPI0039A3A411